MWGFARSVMGHAAAARFHTMVAGLQERSDSQGCDVTLHLNKAPFVLLHMVHALQEQYMMRSMSTRLLTCAAEPAEPLLCLETEAPAAARSTSPLAVL
jgi:hypothetical protein